MDSRDLTCEQARILRERLMPTQRFLHALHERVHQQAFPPDDKVRQLVDAAYEAVFALSVELHYLSVRSGVGREERE
jgi:hypothetical protein